MNQTALEKSTEQFVNSFEPLSNEAFTQKPAPDKWSISEIVEHLNISDKSAYLAMIRTNGLPTDEILESSQRKMNIMITRKGQYVAPESVEPKGIFTEPAIAAQVFLKTRKKLLEFSKNEDMTLLATGLEHPRLGLLTRQQWIEFVTWHANHHQVQIAAIAAHMA